MTILHPTQTSNTIWEAVVFVMQLRGAGPAGELGPVELPEPKPGSGEVVVRIEAAGITELDVLLRSGRGERNVDTPVTPGLEGAGIVIESGPDVEGLEFGDRVVCWGSTGRPGFYTQRVRVTIDQVERVPDVVGLEAAAVLPIEWLTVWHGLRHLAGLSAGETIVIESSPRGFTGAAVQIAKDAGSAVVAIADTPARRQFLERSGVDHVLEPGCVDVDEQIVALTGGRGADVALSFGDRGDRRAVRALTAGGCAVVVRALAAKGRRPPYLPHVKVWDIQLGEVLQECPDAHAELRSLLSAAAAGRIAVVHDGRFLLGDAANAHRNFEARESGESMVLLPHADP
jgi:NADPH:quinone reductase